MSGTGPRPAAPSEALLAVQRHLARRDAEPEDREAQAALAAALFEYAHELRRDGRLDAAVAAFAQAARHAPDHAAAWIAFGNACMELELATTRAPRTLAADEDLVAHAVAAFARAAALEPEAPLVAAKRAMAARYACAWSEAETAASDLARLARERPATFACEPIAAAAILSDPHVQRRGIEGWCRRELPAATPPGPAPIRGRGSRLRVGYLSSDFHDHATAHLIAGLFEHHDRSRIETFAYACDLDDGSAMRARLHGAFGHWRDLAHASDEQAAKSIAADALDVLVDLKGHTHGARPGIVARRPAPVQVHYLGFPGTLAYGAIDAVIVDEIVAPPGCDDEFAERLLRLPVCYQANDDRRVLPPAASREDAGVPAGALVLACFNQTYKLSRPFVETWLDVLRERADAVLWLTIPHALARSNLRAFAQARGVAPERLVFAPMLPQAAHLARLRCADLALDVLPYGSHTTGSDALFAGVPLLTCRGTTFAGRVGASLCAAVELPGLVTESLAAYAARLRSLCADRAERADLRAHLGDRTQLPLFDTARFARAFEDALSACAR